MARKTVVRVKGGLGNQLFSYAAGMFLSENLGHIVKFSFQRTSFIPGRSPMPTIMELNLPKLNRALSPILGSPLGERISLQPWNRSRSFRQDGTGYAGSLDEIVKGAIVEGYFQTHRYLSALPGDFMPVGPDLLRKPSQWLIDLVRRAKVEEPIMMHIRRGDYAKTPKAWGLLSKHYYAKAIQISKERLGDRPIWIFSDDKRIASEFGATLAGSHSEVVSSPSNKSAAEELVLMSSGIANVIANSSFSWWAASLSRSSKLVVAPKPWFREGTSSDQLLPQDWVRLPASWEE
jgi:hypothetical protein